MGAETLASTEVRITQALRRMELFYPVGQFPTFQVPLVEAGGRTQSGGEHRARFSKRPWMPTRQANEGEAVPEAKPQEALGADISLDMCQNEWFRGP